MEPYLHHYTFHYNRQGLRGLERYALLCLECYAVRFKNHINGWRHCDTPGQGCGSFEVERCRDDFSCSVFCWSDRLG
jgi:hypothetical protein